MAESSTSRRVLITGAGAPNGIGFVTAKKFLDAGAKVFLTGHSDRVLTRAEELQGAGFDVGACSADLSDPEQARDMVANALQFLGGIDLLVNNAGMTSVAKSAGDESSGIDQMSSDAWRAALARNLDSVFLVSKAVLPSLRQSAAGRIINITSLTGPVMAMRHEVAYAAAKAGISGLTRALALDEATNGITVNAIAPGWIATDSQSSHERDQGLKVPMKRSGRPEEIASAIFWLASVDAGYITGQTIVIDGGNSIAEER